MPPPLRFRARRLGASVGVSGVGGPTEGPVRSRGLGSPRTRRTTRCAASTTSSTAADPVNHTVIVP